MRYYAVRKGKEYLKKHVETYAGRCVVQQDVAICELRNGRHECQYIRHPNSAIHDMAEFNGKLYADGWRLSDDTKTP